MSRARLGLYVFCRQSLFENCFELARTFNLLVSRPTQLLLVPNERSIDGTTSRKLSDPVEKPFSVSDVAHMGQIVLEETRRAQADIAEYQKRVAEWEVMLSFFCPLRCCVWYVGTIDGLFYYFIQ